MNRIYKIWLLNNTVHFITGRSVVEAMKNAGYELKELKNWE